MSRRSALMNVMVGAAMKAARGLRRDFGEVEHLQVSKKGPADYVSKAAQMAEDVIFEELSHARPGFAFLMEERGYIAGENEDSPCWIIDPLDGTTNFLHGIPHFAISIALKDKGEIIAGVIFNPIADEMFIAEKGNGAFLNDSRLRVSGRTRLEDAVLATGIPFKGRCSDEDFALFSAQMTELMPNVAGIRRNGAAALDMAWLAAGRFDGFWEKNLQPWDLAAGLIILKEAGGYAKDFSGTNNILETGGIIAGNDQIQLPLERVLKRVERELKK